MRISRLAPFSLLPLVLLLFTACSDSDSPTAPPGSGNESARLEIAIPSLITSGVEFEVQVTAVDADGVGPLESFNGTISLSVSSGTVSPSSINVTAGTGVANVVVLTAASSVELSASHPSATGRVQVNCAQPGSVLVTGGRFHLSVGGSAQTQSQSFTDEDAHNLSIPGQMSFSRTAIIEVEAMHQVPELNVMQTAKADAEAELIATGNLADGGRLTSMSIVSSAQASASFDGSTGQGSAGATFLAIVDFSFTVENAPLLAEVVGTFEESSFSIAQEDGTRVLDTFGERAAVLQPGNYFFRARPANAGMLVQSGAKSWSASMDMHLSFTETPPEE